VKEKQIVTEGKENTVLPRNGSQLRKTRVATRRLASRSEKGPPVEVEDVALVPAPVPEDRVLPPGVKDIDEDDGDNPQLCSEYAMETYSYLKLLTTRRCVPANYMTGGPTNDKMRAVLIDWMVEVQIQFKLLQETLFQTVDTIDRFLALEGRSIPRAKLQLVGVSAMFLVSKVEEVYAPAISDFVYITDNAYTEMEIRQMELRILQALDFELCQPVSLNFLRRFSKAGEVNVLQHTLAKYALEICLLDIGLVNTPASLLAAAALYLSLLLLESVDTVWSPTMEHYTGHSAQEVRAVVPRMASNVHKMKLNPKLQAIRVKFKSGKYLKVADIEELKSETLSLLALPC
jgi:hypothetical protein